MQEKTAMKKVYFLIFPQYKSRSSVRERDIISAEVVVGKWGIWGLMYLT